MKNRKFLIIFLIFGLAFALLAGCGASQQDQEPAPPPVQEEENNAVEKEAAPLKKLVVGATPVPHGEILLYAKDLLKEKGYDLEVQEFTDYVIPNIALNDGSLDANFFQHVPYLEEFKENNNMDLTWTVAIHFEPYALYSKKINDLNELKDGDTIAVPNDSTNEARALQLLQDNDIITLKEGVGLSATIKDITEYKVKIKIKELEAALLPRALEDVTGAIINGNYAIDAGLNPTRDSLVMEDPDSIAAETFKNVIAVKTGNENNPEIKALNEVLTSPAIKEFLLEQYDGAVVPVF